MKTEEYKKLLEEIYADDRKVSRVKTRAAEGAWLKWARENIGKCSRCGSTRDLTVDHIIPSSILQSFGIDTAKVLIDENFDLLCLRCNMFKANRLDFANPKTKPLLIRFINEIKEK